MGDLVIRPQRCTDARAVVAEGGDVVGGLGSEEPARLKTVALEQLEMVGQMRVGCFGFESDLPAAPSGLKPATTAMASMSVLLPEPLSNSPPFEPLMGSP